MSSPNQKSPQELQYQASRFALYAALIGTITAVITMTTVFIQSQKTVDLQNSGMKSAEDYHNRGFDKYNLGDSQGAIEDYNQAIKIKPNYSHSYYLRGNAKSKLGDLKEAMEDYNRAIQFQPDFALAYINRGNLQAQLSNKKDALNDYMKAATLAQKQGKLKDRQYALDQITSVRK
jgi:tetratricopeptide (TPR) repeat protein